MSYRQRLILFFIIDSILILGSVYVSYLLRFEFDLDTRYYIGMAIVGVAIWITTYALFYHFKLYRRVWQYASIGELVSIVKAVTIAIAVCFGLYVLYRQLGGSLVIPRSIYPIAWMAIVLSIGGSRFVWRLYRDSYIKIQPHHRRALIIGAGDAGALVVRELKHSMEAELYPVAFIDDDPNKQMLEVVGIPVIGTREDIPHAVKSFEIDTIVIAMPSAPRDQIAAIIQLCKDTGAHIKLLPRVSDLIEGHISVQMIRDVNVEDLLGREPVDVDLEEIARYITGKAVLITGAGGSIGAELCRQVAVFEPRTLLLLGHGENSIFDIYNELLRSYPELHCTPIIADIQDESRMESVFAHNDIDVVFHAAAHKHVPLMEANPLEAIKNNVVGTRNVALMAHRYGVERFVMISTDKAVNPTSVMGATKRIAEMLVQSLAMESETIFTAVRFGNVLGSRGSVIPFFKQQIEAGGPVTVTHPDMVRYFMTIPEAVQLVIQAGGFAEGGEVFILDMGKPVRIVDLARDLIRLSGLEPERDIEIQFAGIRPGEKLYEELLTDEEGLTATRHHRIYIGKPSGSSWEALENDMRVLIGLAQGMQQSVSDEDVKREIKRVVPEYLVTEPMLVK